MAGLFDTLNLGSRSLQTHRKGVDLAGHNLANVNTPGYARQRLAIESLSINSGVANIGNGAEATHIQSIRNSIIDQQLHGEISITSSLDARQRSLDSGLNALNENLQATGDSSQLTSGLSKALGDFFAHFQSVASSPLSPDARSAAISGGQILAQQFTSVNDRLGRVAQSINAEIDQGVSQANSLLDQISSLNEKIIHSELHDPGSALDLRNARQQSIESLAKLLPVTISEQSNGAAAILTGGQSLIDADNSVIKLQAVTSPAGGKFPALSGDATPLEITSGSLHGLIDARDKNLAALQDQVNNLASSLITETNAIYSRGFALDGSTGSPFFTGTSAADIAVNTPLLRNPSLLQASSSTSELGDNRVARDIANLFQKPIAALNNQSFSQRYASIVSDTALEASSLKSQLEDQRLLESTLLDHRNSVSAVSIDEEITTLMQFQKAFQASARFMTVADEMLDSIINLT